MRQLRRRLVRVREISRKGAARIDRLRQSGKEAMPPGVAREFGRIIQISGPAIQKKQAVQRTVAQPVVIKMSGDYRFFRKLLSIQRVFS